MSGVKITERDNGYKKLMKTLAANKRLAVTIGIHAEEGAAASSEGKSLAEVAEINEFGLGPPARPFITPFGDRMAEAGPKAIRDRYAAALKAGADPVQAIDQLAQVWAGEIVSAISAGIPPENAQSTKDRKGSSTPLVDTGQLKAAIRGKVQAG